MRTFALLPGLAAMSLLDPTFAFAQDPDDERKVRIEITRTENGETTRITRELDTGDEQALQEALKELGVMDELKMVGEGENVVIDLRRMREGGMLDDMSVALSMLDGMDEVLPEQRAYLGVHYGTYQAEECDDKAKRAPVKDGCTITHVIEGEAADKAGLKEGDVVVRIADSEVHSGEDLVAALRGHEPNEQVKVTYYRGKEKRTAAVKLGAREDEAAAWNFNIDVPGSEDMDWNAYYNDAWTEDDADAFLGITGGGSNAGGKGVVVNEVIAGSAADRMGLQQGDVIDAINGEEVQDFSALAGKVSAMHPGDAVTVRLHRAGSDLELSGELGRQEPASDAFIRRTPGGPVPPMLPFLSPGPPDGMDAEDREELRREMDELRREMDRLRRDLRGEVTREMRVVIQDMTLSREESALLKGKGVTNIDRPLGWNDLRISPNPGNGTYRITFTAPQRGDLTVDVHNAAGERVYHETITGFKGNYERLLDLGDLPAGPYFLVVAQGGATEARKLVKQ